MYFDANAADIILYTIFSLLLGVFADSLKNFFLVYLYYYGGGSSSDDGTSDVLVSCPSIAQCVHVWGPITAIVCNL